MTRGGSIDGDAPGPTGGTLFEPEAAAPSLPVFELWVPGRAVPQGSMTPYARGRKVNGRFEPFRTRDGRLVLDVKASNEDRLKPWRKHVTMFARAAWDDDPIGFDVNLAAVFVFALWKTR